MMIAGSAIGYVWQKTEIYRLSQQIGQRESRLKQMTEDNEQLRLKLADLRSPVKLDQRVRELKLGLVPAQPSQIWRLPEPAAPPAHNTRIAPVGRAAGRSAADTVKIFGRRSWRVGSEEPTVTGGRPILT